MTAASQLLPMNSSFGSTCTSSRSTLNTRLPSQLKSSNSSLQESRFSRERFVVFLQILLRRLEAAQDHQLKQQCKVLVMQCTRNSKMGGSRTPLVASLELHLRQLVGEAHWRTAIRATHRYFRQKEHQRILYQLKSTQVVGL